MDYTTLQEQVANHFVTTELVPFVPTAITLAEAELNRRLRVRDMLARSFATVDTEYVALPSDFNAMRSVHLETDPSQRLEFLPIEALQSRWGSRSGTGCPRFYALVGDALQLLPPPDTGYELEIAYYARVPELTEANPTNWLLTRHPDVYLYGALLQATPYLHKDQRLAVWSSLYEKAIEGVHLHNERAEFSGGALKMRAKAL